MTRLDSTDIQRLKLLFCECKCPTTFPEKIASIITFRFIWRLRGLSSDNVFWRAFWLTFTMWFLITLVAVFFFFPEKWETLPKDLPVKQIAPYSYFKNLPIYIGATFWATYTSFRSEFADKFKMLSKKYDDLSGDPKEAIKTLCFAEACCLLRMQNHETFVQTVRHAMILLAKAVLDLDAEGKSTRHLLLSFPRVASAIAQAKSDDICRYSVELQNATFHLLTPIFEKAAKGLQGSPNADAQTASLNETRYNVPNSSTLETSQQPKTEQESAYTPNAKAG